MRKSASFLLLLLIYSAVLWIIASSCSNSFENTYNWFQENSTMQLPHLFIAVTTLATSALGKFNFYIFFFCYCLYFSGFDSSWWYLRIPRFFRDVSHNSADDSRLDFILFSSLWVIPGNASIDCHVFSNSKRSCELSNDPATSTGIDTGSPVMPSINATLTVNNQTNSITPNVTVTKEGNVTRVTWSAHAEVCKKRFVTELAKLFELENILKMLFMFRFIRSF